VCSALGEWGGGSGAVGRGGGGGGGFEAIEAEVLAQMWARHGRSSRLTGRWLEGCVPGIALFLSLASNQDKLTAANRCDRRGSACSVQQVGDAKWQAVHYISQVRQRRQQRYLAPTMRRSRLFWLCVEGRLAMQCNAVCQGWECRNRSSGCECVMYGGVVLGVGWWAETSTLTSRWGKSVMSQASKWGSNYH
jgi:hypothetical protein